MTPLDFREQLAKALPEQAHRTVFFRYGCQHPPYNERSLPDTCREFCAQILPQSPIVDPLNTKITLIKTNFVKLLNIKFRAREGKAKASKVLEEVESQTFNPEQFAANYKWEADRMSTLFWLPDVLRNPDAIYRNGHTIIVGDRIYAKVYDKLGSKVKLVFTKESEGGWVIVTSFLTSSQNASDYVRGKPLYLKQEGSRSDRKPS